MTHRPSLVAGFALGAIISTFAIWSGRPGIAQQPPAAAVDSVDTGRYRIAVNDSGTILFVLDSVTGRCWRRTGAGASRWIDYGSPVEAQD